eukprot:3065499-Amphidinium_carterae.1
MPGLYVGHTDRSRAERLMETERWDCKLNSYGLPHRRTLGLHRARRVREGRYGGPSAFYVRGGALNLDVQHACYTEACRDRIKAELQKGGNLRLEQHESKRACSEEPLEGSVAYDDERSLALWAQLSSMQETWKGDLAIYQARLSALGARGSKRGAATEGTDTEVGGS